MCRSRGALSFGVAVRQMVRHGCDRCREVDGINGLREMRLESRREDTSRIFGTRVARQRDRGEKTSVLGFMLSECVG